MVRARRATFCSLLRESNTRFSPLDKIEFQFVLKLLDLHAERRLGDGTRLRRAAEMPCLRKGVQIAKLSQRNH